MIVMWSGSIASIPPGFALCNGANGTPDLRDRFVVGAGTTYNPDDSGGAVNHNHDFTGDGHQHDGTLSGVQQEFDVTNVTGFTATANATGTTDDEDGRPPYYALAYIMKT